jgi:hypothetical protein
VWILSASNIASYRFPSERYPQRWLTLSVSSRSRVIDRRLCSGLAVANLIGNLFLFLVPDSEKITKSGLPRLRRPRTVNISTGGSSIAISTAGNRPLSSTTRPNPSNACLLEWLRSTSRPSLRSKTYSAASILALSWRIRQSRACSDQFTAEYPSEQSSTTHHRSRLAGPVAGAILRPLWDIATTTSAFCTRRHDLDHSLTSLCIF